MLGWALTPGYGVRVRFREDVLQTIGSDGWRTVPGSGLKDVPSLGVYGCSFTYGTGLGDAETFTALLQEDFPEFNVMNRGIGGQGTVQNLLQFRQDIRAGRVDCAVFAMISDHRFRNVPHPVRMQAFLNPEWYRIGVEHVPIARRDSLGKLSIRYVQVWQPVLQKGGFDVFLPDDHMLTSTTLAVLNEAVLLAARNNIPIRFALLDQLDPGFNEAVLTRFPMSVDVSSPHDAQHTFLPADPHPNVKANQLFAQRLRPTVEALIRESRGSMPG